MKNPTAPSLKMVTWVSATVIVIGFFSTFPETTYIIYGVSVYIALMFYRHRKKKKHLTSVENIMFAKFRLLALITLVERIGTDRNTTGAMDVEKHSEILATSCVDIHYELFIDYPYEALAKKYDSMDFIEKFGENYKEFDLNDDANNKKFILDQINIIKKEFVIGADELAPFDELNKGNKAEYHTIRNNIVTDMCKLLLVDNDISEKERVYYNYIAKNLGASDGWTEGMLLALKSQNKKSILESFEVIPDLTKKQILYIDSEYEDLKELHNMSEEDIRDNLPGITKAIARAIKKKLNEAFK